MAKQNYSYEKRQKEIAKKKKKEEKRLKKANAGDVIAPDLDLNGQADGIEVSSDIDSTDTSSVSSDVSHTNNIAPENL
ncbi:hypothetical protein [Colwellia ponticola]|uniref:Uncharacterized protein n=1 Tax=Colwellia ponticola TaxID=2304625 RepID=A0A8H2PM46_9GAMM|nr:hypothetical protein [Colwellia ponticola]RGP39472.1 hypothetical protein BPTFM16_02885 [Altererythrobacter insulae]TMM44000.1 hypothetical protein FCS21_11370 [Colwellia ponticola]